MAKTRSTYSAQRASADQLKDQAMIYAKQVKGGEGKRLRRKITMAWITNEQNRLIELQREAQKQADRQIKLL